MMKHHRHFCVLSKILSVTLAATMLLGTIWTGTALAAETRVEGDYTYTVLDDGTAQITRYSGTASELTVPATLGGADVSSIGFRAFENNDDIKSITFPDTLRTIGESAFYGCDLLETIDFSTGVTEIGKLAFERCLALQAVDIPSNVRSIGEKAFNACPILGTVTLHDGLESMGNRFLAGTVVTEVYLPSTLVSGSNAFAEMEMLESVAFGAELTAIPNELFRNNGSIRSLTIPNTVTTIGHSCMSQMGALESVVIGDSVTEMGNDVLFDCNRLSSVTFGTGLTSLPSSALQSCENLKTVVIPDNITVIGNAAFKDCSRLASVTLGNNVTNLGNYSFERTAITEITLPATVTEGMYPFNECASLKTIHFAEGTTTLVRGLFQKTAVETVVIPDGVTALPADLFSGCQQLTSVTLPAALKSIGSYAFASCTALETLDIPESVKLIDSYAFSNTPALKTCTFHEGLQTLKYGIFANSGLTSVYIPKTLSTTDSPLAESHITDVTFADGIAMLTDNLFRGDGYLTEIEIPDTVIRIGSACFRNTNLEAVIIPDSVKTLGTSLFEECDNLCAVKIGAGVRKLPQFCFFGCDMLQNVVIPETVYEMETSVFERSGLYYQKLPQSLTTIPGWTFKDCANLVKVECSDNLETIGDYAFERCASFTTLQTAAKEVPFNNTTFKDCPQFIDPRFYVFNPAKTGIESTGNIGANHTLVHFTVRYDIRDDWKDEDLVMQKLWLNYPDSFDIVTTSFAAEGFDFDNASYTGDYKSFSLTGGKSSGELRFSAYVNSADAAARDFSAEVEFTHKGTGFRKPIGKVSFTTAKLSIFAPSSVTTPAITVSGYSAVSGSNVNITISRINADGSTDCTVTYPVTPNKYTGKYTAEALRIVPEDKTAVNGDTFEVIATCGGNRSETVRFEFTPGAVKVIQATETVNITKFIAPHETNLSHGNQANTYDITDMFNKGTSPVVQINPKEMLQFKFKLENDENIHSMALMSHKGDEWKFMPLFYDAETDQWIGEGYFDNNSHVYPAGQNYVPGALNLFYYYGERKDTYRSHYYGKAKDSEAVGAGFYYDNEGKPHGDFGNPGGTIMGSVGKAFIHGVTGKWNQVPSDVTVGGLKALWQWGNKNDNLFRTTHHGYAIDDYGNVVFPDDKADMLNRNAENDGRQCNLIDPSGIVYEAVEGNVIVGATATLYKLNEESGEWVEWNAADFEQQNPVLTNSEGAYAWLTDEGRFKVTISKDGYETQTSEEFDVPPEKLGLNFSLVDNTTHPSATVEKNEIPGAFTLTFNKYMRPDTVNADTIQTDGLENVSITPVYLNDGDEYADTFTVTGTPGKSEITFTVTDAAQSYSGVSAEAVTKTITIADSLSIGDVNLDGKITISDVTAIQRHIAEIEQLSEIRLSLADTNGDGEININDCTHLQKYIAEYEGIILGKQSAD